ARGGGGREAGHRLGRRAALGEARVVLVAGRDHALRPRSGEPEAGRDRGRDDDAGVVARAQDRIDAPEPARGGSLDHAEGVEVPGAAGVVGLRVEDLGPLLPGAAAGLELLAVPVRLEDDEDARTRLAYHGEAVPREGRTCG